MDTALHTHSGVVDRPPQGGGLSRAHACQTRAAWRLPPHQGPLPRPPHLDHGGGSGLLPADHRNVRHHAHAILPEHQSRFQHGQNRDGARDHSRPERRGVRSSGRDAARRAGGRDRSAKRGRRQRLALRDLARRPGAQEPSVRARGGDQAAADCRCPGELPTNAERAARRFGT